MPNIVIEKGRELLAYLRRGNPPDLYREPWKDAAEDVGKRGESKARRAAARGATGRLRAELGHELEAEHGHQLTIFITDTAARKGFPYPVAIEFAERYHHAGELRRAIGALGPEAEQALAHAAHRIEHNWTAHGR